MLWAHHLHVLPLHLAPVWPFWMLSSKPKLPPSRNHITPNLNPTPGTWADWSSASGTSLEALQELGQQPCSLHRGKIPQGHSCCSSTRFPAVPTSLEQQTSSGLAGGTARPRIPHPSRDAAPLDAPRGAAHPQLRSFTSADPASPHQTGLP